MSGQSIGDRLADLEARLGRVEELLNLKAEAVSEEMAAPGVPPPLPVMAQVLLEETVPAVVPEYEAPVDTEPAEQSSPRREDAHDAA